MQWCLTIPGVNSTDMKRFIVDAFLLYFLVYIAQPAQGEDVVVTTGLGKVRGTTLTSRLGVKFYAFRGIRYAKPPVGELRFKAPVPTEQWNGIFDATDDGPMCPQPTANLSDVSEDCLRLNVYTKELPTGTALSNVRRPVVVYLHPGGFYAVSGQSKNFAKPHSMMDQNIVFVTMNYRLGSLGFMSTGTTEAPGNAGLKDQVVALRWIKLHIHKFGGDPNSVTLFGYSAGALSITLHMISPMSRGLFHKAIVMSASGVSQWPVPTHQLNLAKRQARLLNCTDGNISQMVTCLKTKDALDFGTSLPRMFDFGEGNPVLLWSPVVEPNLGQERFLIDDPTKLYQSGQFMRIPVIAGISRDEFVSPAISILNNETLRQELDNNFEKIAPICFLYERDTPKSANISAALRKFYLGRGELHPQRSLEGLAHLFADSLIGFAVHRFVNLAARFTRVYQYRFSFQGRWSHTLYPDDKPYGVVHHDELIYLLNGPDLPVPLFTEEYPESYGTEVLTRMWANFAQRGDPNKLSDQYLRSMRWRPYTRQRQQFLEIGEELVMKEKMYEERYQQWNKLFPLTWIRRSRVSVPSGDEDYPEPEQEDLDNVAQNLN